MGDEDDGLGMTNNDVQAGDDGVLPDDCPVTALCTQELP